MTLESLRGHTSGFAIPTFVIDAPQGGGKVPISPQYLISYSEKTAVIRNYEGLITSYRQPSGNPTHDPASCPACQTAMAQSQEGVSALLSGHQQAIIPESWSTDHQRSVPLPENLQPRKIPAVIVQRPIHAPNKQRFIGTKSKSAKGND